MKFGIIGAGMIANFHARAINAMTNGELHSFYGRRQTAVDELVAEHGGIGYTDLDAFLSDPELEIVTIATPSGAHLEPAVAAAKARKHVVCEKPLEITTNRIDQMIATCEANGVTLSGIFNRRFLPAVSVFKEAVDTGRFGQLTMCDAYVKWYRDQAYYDSGAWRGTWDLDGGGALMNQGIHTIDQLIYIAGDVVAVSATADCLIHDNIEVEDTIVAILEFASGARGVLQASTACWSSTGHPAEVHVCGEKGSAFLVDEAFRVWDFLEGNSTDDEVKANLMLDSEGKVGKGANDPKAIDFSGHQRNFEDVVDAIQNDRAPKVDGKEARRAVALIQAIYDSAKLGGNRVELG